MNVIKGVKVTIPLLSTFHSPSFATVNLVCTPLVEGFKSIVDLLMLWLASVSLRVTSMLTGPLVWFNLLSSFATGALGISYVTSPKLIELCLSFNS